MTDQPGALVSGRIVKQQPPNIAAIHAAFPMTVGRKGLLFAYGDAIYAPDGEPIAPQLVVHEATHMRQQAACGGPEKWWEIYLADPKFRLVMELEAGVAELEAYAENAPRPNRKMRAHYLDALAERLSSGVYGYMIRKPAARAALARGLNGG